MHRYFIGLATIILSLSVQAIAPQEASKAAIPPEHGQAAWILADATTGQIESTHNAQLLLKPASTQKLLTTLAGAWRWGRTGAMTPASATGAN
ncbi:hypothetical protein [Oceanisphaera psychrotolerans]|uniref:hypothetical protein n=1 Tax=Oceanisphaera psychrotolerans TaxID=1414654 RepID=UPI001FE1030A|nr:hypothetical protein [Oceanisphaera psychrotolerans]